MRFITDDLEAKIRNGTATEHERAVHKILSLLGDVPPAEAAQKLMQADAVCGLRDDGRPDLADAMLQLFVDGDAITRLMADGKYEFSLTEQGVVRAAALVQRMAMRDDKLN